MIWSRILRFTLVMMVLVVLLILARPWIESAWYGVRLSWMPPPSSLAMPVDKVRQRSLNDTWHASRPPKRRHEGIDIFARKGTPVLSATEGVVLDVGQNNLGGNVVWVLGPGGQRHYYAHLDSFADIGAGDRVAAGTVLGYVGNTGNAKTTPPHLHYGVYTSAGAINPYPLLVAHPAG